MSFQDLTKARVSQNTYISGILEPDVPIRKMKIFPILERKFKLNGEQNETIARLTRRTEISETLSSSFTDKSFRGLIEGNKFKLITSLIGFGAFCVMKGEIIKDQGHVKVEINKPFRIFLSIFLCLPMVLLVAMLFDKTQELSPLIILVVIGQILMIRYLFIGLVFWYLSKLSLNSLADVLDIEWQ